MTDKLLVLVAGGFGSGFVPKAPGTAGTLVAIPIALLLSHLSPPFYLLLILAMTIGAALICDKAARIDGEKDPSWIVLDEIIGFLFAVLWLPRTLPWYMAAFFLFRLFDILKPWVVGWLDRNISGGWGIVLDDVAAGIFTRVALLVLSIPL